MEQEVKVKLPPLAKKFVSDIQAANGLVDTAARKNELDEVEFLNPVTHAMWLGYKLGHARARRSEPGWFITGKVTDKGIELSPQPKGNWHAYAAAKAVQWCEQKFGGNFIALMITGPAYAKLKRVYEGNPCVQRKGDSDNITSIPFFIRK